MSLAALLGMTLARLEAEMSVDEYQDWLAWMQLREEDARQARRR